MLAPFFKAGLEKGEYCLWVVSASLTTEQAAAALRPSIPDVDRHLREGLLEFRPQFLRHGEPHRKQHSCLKEVCRF
jgi:hypothetical protein